MTMEYSWTHAITSFHHGDRQLEGQVLGPMAPPPTGTGVLWNDGNRYRVVDTWLSFDTTA